MTAKRAILEAMLDRKRQIERSAPQGQISLFEEGR